MFKNTGQLHFPKQPREEDTLPVLRPERERELPNLTRTQKLGRYEHLFELVVNSQTCSAEYRSEFVALDKHLFSGVFPTPEQPPEYDPIMDPVIKAITNERDLSKHGVIKT